jgi:hypothetical protein
MLTDPKTGIFITVAKFIYLFISFSFNAQYLLHVVNLEIHVDKWPQC